MTGRLEHQDDLKELIEAWLADKTMAQAAEILLAHGIPAGPILDVSQILDDPHVKEREMFVRTEHPTLGEVTVNGCAVKLMGTPAAVRAPAPALGQDNEAVFSALGLSPAELAALKEKNVF